MDLGGAQGIEVEVCPSVRGNLMAAVKGVLGPVSVGSVVNAIV